jgi:acyl carrier protein
MENNVVLKTKNLEERLNKLFIKRFNLDMDKFNEEYKSKKLLSSEIGMSPRDLLYLFFDIENEFGIVIPQESVASGEFGTYNGILGIISDKSKCDE